MGYQIGRGPEAVEDMRNRLAAGWTVADLWDRATEAQTAGYSYDYAEQDQPARTA